MTGMLTDKRPYENSETKEWNGKNSKRNRQTGNIKIGNLTVGVHNTSKTNGTKLGK